MAGAIYTQQINTENFEKRTLTHKNSIDLSTYSITSEFRLERTAIRQPPPDFLLLLMGVLSHL